MALGDGEGEPERALRRSQGGLGGLTGVRWLVVWELELKV